MMANLLEKVVSMFAKQPEEKEESLDTNDTAWAESSSMYTAANFEKYNPDDLISRKGYGIYSRMMIDEQVKAVTKFKRDAITSRDYFFELDGDKYGLSEKEVDDRIKLSEHIVESIRGSWVDALNGVMTATYNGFSLTEIIPAMIDFKGLSWWGVEKLRLKPFDTFYFSVDEYGNITKTTQKLSGKEQDIDLDKFIHYVVNPDVDEHYGGSELRAAYRAWFSKDNTIKFRNIWLEKHAGGFRVLQPPEGKSINPNSAEYVALQAILNNINVSTGIILPYGYTLDSKYPDAKVAFNEAIDDNDTAIARALLVPNLLGVSPQGDTGSYSQSTNQLKAFFWTLKSDGNRLDDVLNEQLFSILGRINFGDEGWPRYKSKPISMDEAIEIVKTWKDLVTSKAVRVTDTDEKYVRDLLEFPEAGEEILNEPNKQPEERPGSNGEGTDDGSDIGDGVSDNDGNNSEKGGGNKEGDGDEELAAAESTIIGKGSISVSAFSRAMRRVDFAVVAKNSDSIVDEYSQKTAEIMDLIVADLISKSRGEGSLDEEIKSNIKVLKVDKQLKRRMFATQTAMLREGGRLGKQHAALEIDKAKKDSFSRRVDMVRLNLIAEDFYQTTAFKITGNFTDEAVKLIEAEILNGSRYDKTWKEVEESIYRTFATKGLITTEQAKDALGEALGVSNPDARIRTVVRTSTFDVINNARYSYFTDPQLGGFAIGFEYSSILDSRTTQICRHLDEENRGNHNAKWYEENAQYKPPNHYNCRSLLIPVTKVDGDDFVEGDEPTMEPQVGFK